MSTFRTAAAALLSAGALLACSKSTPPPPDPSQAASAPSDLRVTDIEVPRTFAPADSLAVTVKTEGSAPNATLMAVWTYEDQRLTESEQTINPTGPTVVSFQLPKPDGPQAAWPAGDYKVKILLNGVLAGSQTFEVKAAG